ncbi:Uncharacterised protein [Gemella morbillorum]|uniref:hypothetical protein n=1 Tax=Gemella morbillorum TaxID=29391 RepID=UPI000DA2F05D|nr:hypothetical protein [Gemella morbillorum]UBH81420.1 hypothetical protein LA320_03740 [Gemella morbillorum]SQH55190.1 Uncharacterised protein [Gemella morbillorum]
MNEVRIKLWFKNGEFLETLIDAADVIDIKKACDRVRQGTVRNKDLKITVSNKTFYVDDVEKGVYCRDYPFTIHEPLSTVKIEERNGIEDEFNDIKYKFDDYITRIEERFLIAMIMFTLIVLTLVAACRILGG